jgi:hypothetical protein
MLANEKKEATNAVARAQRKSLNATNDWTYLKKYVYLIIVMCPLTWGMLSRTRLSDKEL